MADSGKGIVGTITGRVLAALERAPRLPLADARPPAEPGWYALELDGREPPVFAAEAGDLAGRLAWHRERLVAGAAIAPRRVAVRWVLAAPVLGQGGCDRRARRAVEGVLVSTLRPLWDADAVAALSDPGVAEAPASRITRLLEQARVE